MLAKAIQYAKKNPVKGLPRFAALITDKKRIVSYGFNSWTTHPLQAKFCMHPEAIHLHAEIAAIAAAKCDVEGMSMFVARVLRSGEPALARPCKGCQDALLAFKFKNVYWTE
jgi:pyrimidine deaminase RibD-like protein